MFFNQKVNIKILVLVFFASCLLTGYTFLTAIPALEKGDNNDVLLALFFRIPTQGYSWDYFYHMPANEILRLITYSLLLSIFMERVISYLKFLDKKRNEEDNS